MAKFTADEKIQIVLRYLNGNESYREIGKAIGVRDTAMTKNDETKKPQLPAGIEALPYLLTRYFNSLFWRDKKQNKKQTSLFSIP